jgi:hypothetical protein
MSIKLVAMASLALFFAQASFAQKFASQTLRVDIHHTADSAGVVTLDPVHGKGSASQSLKDNPTIELDPGWKASVTVVDKNPLLFTYSFGEVQTTNTESYAAFLKLAEAVKTFVDGTKVLASGDVDQHEYSLQVGSLDTSELQRLANRVAGDYGRIGVWIDDSFQKHDVPGSKPDVEDINTLKAQSKAASANASKFVAALDKLSELTVKIAQGAKLEARFYVDGARHELPSGSWFELQRNVRSLGDDATSSALEEQLAFLDFVRQEKESLRSMASTLQSFAKVAGGVNAVADGDTKELVFDAKHVQKLPISIKANNQFESFFSPLASTYQKNMGKTGDFSISTEPEEKVHLSISPGIIYSFVKNPEFSASADDEGVITVQEQSSDYAAIDGMIALNMTPDSHYGRGFEPFLQVGLAPSSDKTAFLLGVGFKAYKELVASVGVVYQRVSKLDGMKLGDVLTSSDDLKTKKEFKAGLYISFGVGF